MLVLAGCEGTFWSAKAPKDQDALAKKFAPEDTSAVIYVYRHTAAAMFASIFLYNDGEMVAATKDGSFIRLVVSPGAHVIGVKAPSARLLQDELPLNVQAGKLYYAELQVDANPVTYTPKLRQVDEAVAQKEILGCDLLTVGPL